MTKTKQVIFYLPIIAVCCLMITACNQNKKLLEDESDLYDGADKAAQFEYNRTKNPFTGKIDRSKMWQAVLQTTTIKNNLLNKTNTVNTPLSANALSWIERGSYTDAAGAYTNQRPGNGAISGRVRAIWADVADATGKTVWAGGVDGGLWKTTDITASPVNWVLVNDFLSNLAVTGICQDPTNNNIMYFCTGESFFNADAVNGNGVFKSVDHGVTWMQLSSTSSLVRCSKILCDALGNVYVSTIGISVAVGLQRSNDGGNTWATINPLSTSRITDFVFSSTGTMHIVGGLFSAAGIGGYRFTNNPATVTPTTWSASTTPFTIPFTTNGNGGTRVSLACNSNTVYAAMAHTNSSNATSNIDSIAKSTDGGNTWKTTGLTSNNITDLNGNSGGQGWYSMAIGVDPSNANNIMIGSLNILSSTDGGNTFSTITQWVGTTGQFVHADQHNIFWYNNGNKLLVGCDGGVFFTADKGTTFVDRNTNLRLKQFYSVAVHPTTTNYFIGGTQDNGVHQLTGAGLSSSIEVTGGDGAYVAIDQNQPQYQFGSYVYNQYRRSTDGGATWATVNLSSTAGMFINPFDYDNINKKMYCGYSAGQYLRWDNPQTGSSNTAITISNFNGANIAAVCVSSYTNNRVYFGTDAGRVVMVDNANTALPTATTLTPTTMTGYVNGIVEGATNQNLIATISSYGVNNVWLTTNGGTSWTQCDGNLPDMPVYWALFNPDDNTKAYIATEAGVWSTALLNGANTVWVPETNFPTVKTVMLKYRSSDRLIAAATHGRGIWTANLPASCTSATITSQPTNTSVCAGSNTTFNITGTGSSYQWQVSIDGGNTFANINNGNIYSGTTSTSLNIINATTTINLYQYRCVVTGVCNTTTTNIISNAAVLTVNATPSVSVNASGTTVCAGTNVTLIASGASTYLWMSPTATGNTVTVVPLVTSTYTVTGSIANGCSNTTAITINATPKPIVTLSASPYYNLLPGQTTTLTANANSSTTSNFIYNWVYTGPYATPNFVGNTFIAGLNNTGTYTVTAAEANNLACVSLSASVIIGDSVSNKLFVYPNPNSGQFSVSFYNSNTSSTNQIVSIFNSVGQRVFSNSFAVTQPYQILQINITNLSAGIYFIDVRDAIGNRLKTGKVEIK